MNNDLNTQQLITVFLNTLVVSVLMGLLTFSIAETIHWHGHKDNAWPLGIVFPAILLLGAFGLWLVCLYDSGKQR